MHSYYLKKTLVITSNNLPNFDIHSNQKNDKENINLESKYQLTELNTYLKVEKEMIF